MPFYIELTERLMKCSMNELDSLVECVQKRKADKEAGKNTAEYNITYLHLLGTYAVGDPLEDTTVDNVILDVAVTRLKEQLESVRNLAY